MKIIHPALRLFKEMFDDAAKDSGPVSPSYYVPRDTFLKNII